MDTLETLLQLIQELRPQLPTLLDPDTAASFDRTLQSLEQQATVDPKAARIRIFRELRSNLKIRSWTEQYLSKQTEDTTEQTRSPVPNQQLDIAIPDFTIYRGDVPKPINVEFFDTAPPPVSAIDIEPVAPFAAESPDLEISELPNLESLDTEVQDSFVIGAPPSNMNAPDQAAADVENSNDETSSNEVSCYVKAEMKNLVVLHEIITITVTVSPDSIELINNATTKSQKISINPVQKLIVQVIAKTNFEIIESDRIEITPEHLKEPQELYFDLKSTHLGTGEIWVIIRQSQLPLATLKLTPEIVNTSTSTPTQTLSAQATISAIPQSTDVAPHQLRITERQNGTQITYEYTFESSLLNILELHTSKAITSDRQTYINQIYQEIESRWSNVQADQQAFAEELRAFGGHLLDELFPERLQDLLWQHRQHIQSILVISTEPFIPWEIVHLKDPKQPYLPDEVCFLGQLGLVRWLYDAGSLPPTTLTLHRDRCRYLIPHYPDKSGYHLPQAEQEIPFLQQTFQATAIAPHPNAAIAALKAADFDLLHFAGHGETEPGSSTAKLLLEGLATNKPYVPSDLSATTVSQHCRFKATNTRPLILLNACQVGRSGYALTGISGFAPAFLKGGAGAFIGSLWSVGDRPARIFSETLYVSLLAGSNLAAATRAAREQSKNAGDATWLAYVVYGHPHLQVTLDSPQA
jgi:hypothetical protein